MCAKRVLSGPEMVRLMKVGTRVVRGEDWRWGNQDGNPPGEGQVVGQVEDGWIRILWDHGFTNQYRMGQEGRYDVKLAEPSESSECVEPEDSIMATLPLGKSQSEAHPTMLIRHATFQLLRIILLTVATCEATVGANEFPSFFAFLKTVTQVTTLFVQSISSYIS